MVLGTKSTKGCDECNEAKTGDEQTAFGGRKTKTQGNLSELRAKCTHGTPERCEEGMAMQEIAC